MFKVLTCLTTQHDWRLVGLAAAICLLASFVVVSLFHRARATEGRLQSIWIGLASATAGCGIWATHFIAMLAYEPGFELGYDIKLTVLSLILATLAAVIAFKIALYQSSRWFAAIGGAVLGGGIAAMHYTGMFALELPGHVTWVPSLVVLSILAGTALGSFALAVANSRSDISGTAGAATLLTLAIVSHHFTAMGAAEIVPDPTRVFESLSLSPSALAFNVAVAAIAILGMALVAALADRNSENKLRRQKLQLDTALENMSQGLCMCDAEGKITLFNDRYTQIMGLSRSYLQDRSLLDLFKLRQASGDFSGDPDEFFTRVLNEIRIGKSNTKILEAPNGRALRVVNHPMANGGWVATFEDITEARKAEAQISYLARHDPLTDLPNRTLFRDEMDHALRRVQRGEQVAVLCIDLDHFKDVNDSLGHPIGDQLLQSVSKRLIECVRQEDTVARLGGDEFAIVQVGTSRQPGEAAALAGRLIEVIAAPYDLSGHHVVIGASIGVSIAPLDGTDPDQLLKNADLALYRAKSDGRGIYRFFETEMDARAQARRSLELDLRRALLKGEFELYFQPIHDLKSSEILGFEALVRWNHPEHGLISPSSFIPLAEETGLIVQLGEWVLRKACDEAARWSKNVRVAVNLSPVQFKNRNLITTVVSALSSSGLRPHRLELEITESVLLHDGEATLATLHALRNMGVRISMDDFGTGYSSLSYLRSFPFDKIKIDRSFVEGLTSRNDSMAIIKAVTGLGKSMGISTTAEGVETKEQLEMLRKEGCSEVQGYLFSPPRPAAEVEEMLSPSRPRIVARSA